MNALKAVAAAGLAAVLAVPVANAAQPAPRTQQAAGFYLGGSVGRAEARDWCDGWAGACDDKDRAWKIFGGYQFNPNIGVEVGYTDLGRFSASGVFLGTPTSVSSKVKAVEAVAVGTLPLTNAMGLYGKLGLYRYDADANVTFGSTAGGFDNRSTELTYGAGLRFDFTRNTAARVEWQRYGDLDIDVLSVGVMFRF